MMLGGHFLQGWVLRKFDFSLKDHIEAIALVIILITTLPVFYKLFFGKKKNIAVTKTGIDSEILYKD
jgi:membrane-associated protein